MSSALSGWPKRSGREATRIVIPGRRLDDAGSLRENITLTGQIRTNSQNRSEGQEKGYS